MPVSRSPAAVVGAGAATAAGDLDELWAALCAGRPSAAPWSHPDLPADTPPLTACQAAGLDPEAHLSRAEARRVDRTHLLAVAAAEDALTGLAGELPPPERRAVVCGVGHGGSSATEAILRSIFSQGLRGLSPFAAPVLMPSSVAAHLSLRFGFRGPCQTVSTACASGTTAIGEGLELLRRGAADLVLAGGVDAMVTFGYVCMFLRLGVLSANPDPATASRPFDAGRDGFVLGEGAGFVVLERAADARARGRLVLGQVAGYAATADAHHLVAPPADGEGARRCMELALADAGLAAAAIGHVNAHGTSTQQGDLAEARAMAAVFAGAPPPVTAVKGCTGHMVGGSGAVEAIVTLRSLATGLVPPVAGLGTPDPALDLDVVAGRPRQVGGGHALSTSFGFGGQNAALVLAGP